MSLSLTNPLIEKYYKGLEPSAAQAASNTAYKWSFADKTSRADDEALRAAREEVSSATYNKRKNGDDTSLRLHDEPSTSLGGPSSGRVRGPTLPTSADLVHARELESEYKEEERKHKRKRDKLEAKERVEEMVGPKEVGKAGMLEKKRVKREQDRAFREKGDDGLEADETTLIGGGDGFRDAYVVFPFLEIHAHRVCYSIARRDAAKRRFETKAQEKDMQMRERANAMREKEKVCTAFALLLPCGDYHCTRRQWICSSSWQSRGSADGTTVSFVV